MTLPALAWSEPIEVPLDGAVIRALEESLGLSMARTRLPHEHTVGYRLLAGDDSGVARALLVRRGESSDFVIEFHTSGPLADPSVSEWRDRVREVLGGLGAGRVDDAASDLDVVLAEILVTPLATRGSIDDQSSGTFVVHYRRGPDERVLHGRVTAVREELWVEVVGAEDGVEVLVGIDASHLVSTRVHSLRQPSVRVATLPNPGGRRPETITIRIRSA